MSVMKPMKTVNNFNSHAHVERDVTIVHDILRARNFNSHAHVERDNDRKFNRENKQISTHTLTWSVTTISKNHLSKN